MKKIITLALSLGIFAFGANAQVARKVDPSQKIQRDSTYGKRGKMMKDLNLTADQKAQMKANHEYTQQQRQAIINDQSLTSDQRKDKLIALRNNQKEKMNSILTPDQKSKMKSDTKEWKHDNKMRGKEGKGKMMKDLNLTDAQKAQLKANNENLKKQSDAIKNDASLTQEQRKEKLQGLRKTRKDQMNSVLTPAQKAKMQADKKNWKQHGDKKNKGNKKNGSSSSAS